MCLCRLTHVGHGGQAVILLFEHGDYGSAGIILNRRTTRRIGELQRAELLGQKFAGALSFCL